MASDDVNITEDAEMADYDGDKVVTMMDVLQEQQEFEDDANAVLGASDDKNCTYPKGYIKRQALYACLTCCTEAKADPTKRAGVCLACSLTCHENHELIELYTKRNFRCDCGNPKFNSHPCQFTSSKNDLNDENIYNQNFSGLYCTCHRPYPDPDSTLEDDMIQCIICEDWLHASHLEATVPANDQYSEMVCKGCMEKNEFLHDYSAFTVNLDSDVDIITVNGHTNSADDSLCNGELKKEKLVNGISESNTETKATDAVKLNGDVEMTDDGKKSEDNAITSTENDKVDASIPPKASDKAKEDETSNLESTETKPENEGTENADNINSMELDTESKVKNEQSEETTETNEQTESQKSTTTEEPIVCSDVNAAKMESQEETDLTKLTTDDTETNNKTENDDKTVSTDNKEEGTNEEISNTDKDPEKMDEAKEDNETQEQNNEQSIVEEKGDGDNADKMTHSTEKTEQQLLDDLSALTADNPTSEEKDSSTEEKPVQNSETSGESKKNEDNADIDDKVPEETDCGGGDSSEAKAQTEAKPDNSNIQVPDTSQAEQLKENDEEKPDSVMDAIDELLDTANETKQSESSDENNENASESTETKTNTDNVENKQSDDVEMSENKPEADVPEKPEETVDQNEKSADVEMSQNKPVMSESKIDSETTTESTKDNDSLENSDSKTSVDADKTNMDESSKDDEKATEINDTATDNSKENEASKETDDKLQQNEESTNENEAENTGDHKRKLSVDLTEDVSSKKAKIEVECVRPKGVKKVHKGATFWPTNFRQMLCTCGECISMYKDLHVLFLNDLEDTVSAYESLGKENVAGGASQYEKGLQALSSLDRIQQINALTEYNKMRDKLLDFLKSFKDRKEIVKEEDIKAFFAGMKPRREPDGVYFCR